jgi:hypothetical protein
MAKVTNMRTLLTVLLVSFTFMSVAYADFVADAQSAAAENLRKQLPMKVDEFTTLVTVATAGRTAIYSYRIDLPVGELPAGWREGQVPQLTYNLCNHPLMRKMMKQGADYSYQYVDIGGKHILYFKVDEAKC